MGLIMASTVNHARRILDLFKIGRSFSFLVVVALGFSSIALDLGSIVVLKTILQENGVGINELGGFIGGLDSLTIAILAVAYFCFASAVGVITLFFSARFASFVVTNLVGKVISNTLTCSFKEAIDVDRSHLLNSVSGESQRFLEKCIYQFIVITIRLLAIISIGILAGYLFSIKIFVILFCVTIFYGVMYLSFNRILKKNSTTISSGNRLRMQLIAHHFDDLEESILRRKQIFVLPEFSYHTKIINDSIASNAVLGAAPRHVIDAGFFSLITLIAVVGGNSTSVNSGLVLIMAIAIKLVPYCQQLYVAIVHLKGNLGAWESLALYLESFQSKTLATDFNLDVGSSTCTSNWESFRVRTGSVFVNSSLLMREFDLVFERGSRVLVQGPSGGGKTTFLRILAGFFDEDSDHWIDDEKLAPMSDRWRRSISYVSQKGIVSGRTLKEMFGDDNGQVSRNYLEELSKRYEVDELLAENWSEVTVNDPSRVGSDSWSFGQMQRMKIIRALLNQPKILLLDEAFSGIHYDMLLKIRVDIDGLNIPFIFEVAHDRLGVESYTRILNVENGYVSSN